MRNEKDDLIALANTLISELPANCEDVIDRWCSAVADGLSDQDQLLIDEVLRIES
jgi:hypothetical protein